MLLVIDSATAACSVALFAGSTLMGECHEVVGRGHAERLIPMVRELLGAKRPQAILVDCGPGSFTGLRVGLAAAHGLAIGWGVPLSGYSSLAAIAAGVRTEEHGEEIAVALHAGHGQLFVQSYAREPLQSPDALRSLLPDEAAASIAAHHVYGSGAEALVKARGRGQAHDVLPRAADAILLPEPLRTLPPRPIYGRAPDAKPMA